MKLMKVEVRNSLATYDWRLAADLFPVNLSRLEGVSVAGAPNERRFCGRWGGFMPGSEAFRLREKGSMNE